MSHTKILLNNLSKSFNGKQVLLNLNLEVKKGESLVIIGGSGSGKSVLIKCILGLIQPTSGDIYINDIDMKTASKQMKKELLNGMGMLFQGGALFDSLRVWENVAFGLTHAYKVPKKKALEIAIEKLKAVGLGSDTAMLWPAELSGGMQKRVALARAIATDPKIIFFDEPTAGLDPIMSDVINQLIKKCVSELGATAITITHDMHSVKTIAHRVAMLKDGHIIWRGPVDQLEHSGDSYVNRFIHGQSAA